LRFFAPIYLCNAEKTVTKFALLTAITAKYLLLAAIFIGHGIKPISI